MGINFPFVCLHMCLVFVWLSIFNMYVRINKGTTPMLNGMANFEMLRIIKRTGIQAQKLCQTYIISSAKVVLNFKRMHK